jgi:hypothetical protein
MSESSISGIQNSSDAFWASLIVSGFLPLGSSCSLDVLIKSWSEIFRAFDFIVALQQGHLFQLLLMLF